MAFYKKRPSPSRPMISSKQRPAKSDQSQLCCDKDRVMIAQWGFSSTKKVQSLKCLVVGHPFSSALPCPWPCVARKTWRNNWNRHADAHPPINWTWRSPSGWYWSLNARRIRRKKWARSIQTRSVMRDACGLKECLSNKKQRAHSRDLWRSHDTMSSIDKRNWLTQIDRPRESCSSCADFQNSATNRVMEKINTQV